MTLNLDGSRITADRFVKGISAFVSLINEVSDNVSGDNAEDARELIWQHNLYPKDSIHVATAVRLKLSVFDTFDSQLIKLSGKLGNPPLTIGHPSMQYQPDLPAVEPGGKAKPKKRQGKSRS